ncbi:DUF302 domain-containing protein [Streptomyces nigrescens]
MTEPACTPSWTSPGDDAVGELLGVRKGFGVLSEIDVTATLKAKLGYEVEDYVILGACNLPFAHQALEADRTVELLPCNVMVRAEGESTVVQAMDPGTTVTLTGLPALEPIAAEATRRLDAALAALT